MGYRTKVVGITMKTPAKLQATVIGLIATLIVLKVMTTFLWPLLGGLVVLLVLLFIFKVAVKDRFY